MKKTILTLAAFATMASAHAVPVWTNPITDTNPSTSNPYTNGQTVAANLTVSGIGRGAGITANAGADRYNATSWTTGASVDLTDYFTFTLTPAAGYQISFNSFTFTGQRSNTGPTSFAFRSSLDGYTANIGTPTITGTTAMSTAISLSAGAYQNITTAITFRIYGYAATGGTFSVNDFTFDGLVAVPEPHQYGIVFAGMLVALVVARRRRAVAE